MTTPLAWIIILIVNSFVECELVLDTLDPELEDPGKFRYDVSIDVDI